MRVGIIIRAWGMQLLDTGVSWCERWQYLEQSFGFARTLGEFLGVLLVPKCFVGKRDYVDGGGGWQVAFGA